MGQIMGIRLAGFPAWFAWRTYYLLALPRWERRIRVALDWTLDLLFERDVVQLKGATIREEPYMDLTKKKCVPCEGGTPPMPPSEEDKYKDEIPSWELNRDGNHSIERQFEFSDFQSAMSFVNRVADLAEDEGHHPDICINYNKVHLELSTHAAGGLTENDFIVAAKINEL